MIGFKIDQSKSMFFDRKTVKSATDKAERRVLSRFGAFVRRASRSSIRKRKRVSNPGDPPSSHTGLLRRFIFFAYDRAKSSVVIGPARLNDTQMDGVPELLEHGGTVRGKRTVFVKERVRDAKGRFRIKTRRLEVNKAEYKARPFMGPAFERELPKVPQMWRDAIK